LIGAVSYLFSDLELSFDGVVTDEIFKHYTMDEVLGRYAPFILLLPAICINAFSAKGATLVLLRRVSTRSPERQ